MIRVVSIVKHMAHGAPSATLLQSDQCLSQFDSGIAAVNLMRVSSLWNCEEFSVSLLKGECPATNPPAHFVQSIFGGDVRQSSCIACCLCCAKRQQYDLLSLSSQGCLLKGHPLLTPFFGAPRFEGTEDEQT